MAPSRTHLIAFAAMGGTASVAVTASSGRRARAAASAARGVVAAAEARWSRFLADSDVSRLNRNPGRPVVVDASTLDLLEQATAAWEATDGRFSPFALRAVVGLGYATSMTGRWAGASPAAPLPVLSLPPGSGRSCAAAAPASVTVPAPVTLLQAPLRIDRERSAATLDGAGLDLGGIGKGAAADRAVATARRLGATSACVEIGGDLAMDGDEPWTVEVEDPFRPGRVIAEAAFLAGGVATSSVRRRRWRGPDGMERHHLVDPRTGINPGTRLASVTVAAASATAAEVMTKDLLVGGAPGPFDRVGPSAHLDVLVVADDGTAAISGAWTPRSS